MFIALEYAQNGDLLDKIKREGKFSESEYLPMFEGILSALGHIHSKGILHRDIKLDNILIDKHGKIKLCDFGVSWKMPEKGKVYEHIGTPAYLAPEIIKEKGYNGFGADVWSLGVMTYIALTGEVPF